jgi:NAD(P)-dependent dehydrogenase (short-subunit alcohol dehydrogenase family)
MELYRARPGDGVVWITGASSGIGRKLALDLAAEGYDVAATARSDDKLHELVKEVSGAPGKIIAFPGDVTDAAAMERLVERIEDEAGAVVLAIFNAGNYFPASGTRLNAESFRQTYEINMFGIVNGLVPLVERMKVRGMGHIAFVSSVSGYGGLPTAAAYGASKAAVINMAEALKFDFDRLNIRIQCISPGFIDTPLTEGNKFPMPALMSVDNAVKRITYGLQTGGFEITFPRRFTFWLKLVNLLPYPAYFWIIARITGWNRQSVKKR